MGSRTPTNMDFLGNNLHSKDGPVPTEQALKGKKAVALYFSAHWCPPCRQFTPQLAEWYTSDLKAAGLEVVFMSGDKDEAAFNEYFGEMPWLALPYEARELKEQLSKKYKVAGIPSVVIVNPANGETITTDGRAALTKDPTGLKMPWIPPTKDEKREMAKAALGVEFVDASGETVTRADGWSKDYIGIYFSAHWCPPCRNFTPKLAEHYTAGLKDKMDIVFVSSDKDAGAFKEYLGEMPWMALPYEKREAKAELSDLYGVEGIPTFVVVDKDFNVITTDGTSRIGADPKGENLPEGWKPQPFADVNDDPSSVNGETCMVVMGDSPGGIEEVAKEFHALAGGEVEGMKYRFYTCPKGSVEEQIRKLTNTADKGNCLVVLDIPDSGGFYYVGEDVSATAVRDAIAKYEAKGLDRQQMG